MISGRDSSEIRPVSGLRSTPRGRRWIPCCIIEHETPQGWMMPRRKQTLSGRSLNNRTGAYHRACEEECVSFDLLISSDLNRYTVEPQSQTGIIKPQLLPAQSTQCAGLFDLSGHRSCEPPDPLGLYLPLPSPQLPVHSACHLDHKAFKKSLERLSTRL